MSVSAGGVISPAGLLGAVAVVAWRFKRGRAALILLDLQAIMLATSLSPVNTAQLTRMSMKEWPAALRVITSA